MIEKKISVEEEKKQMSVDADNSTKQENFETDSNLIQLKNEWERKFSEVLSKISDIQRDVQDSGSALKAAIKRKVDGYEGNSDYINYYSVFYWTSLNLFGAYQTLDTSLVQANIEDQAMFDSQIINIEKIIDAGTKLVKCGNSWASKIPIVGGIFTGLNWIIDFGKENSMRNKIKALNGIIRSKFKMQEDLSLTIAQVAISMTEVRKESMDNPLDTQFSEAQEELWSWAKDKFNAVKQKIFPELKIEDMESFSAQLALKDVALFFRYLLHDTEKVIQDKRPLEEQCLILVQREYTIKGIKKQFTKEKQQRAISIKRRIEEYLTSKGGTNSLFSDIRHILFAFNSADEEKRVSKSNFKKDLQRALERQLLPKIEQRIREFIRLEVDEFMTHFHNQLITLSTGDNLEFVSAAAATLTGGLGIVLAAEAVIASTTLFGAVAFSAFMGIASLVGGLALGLYFLVRSAWKREEVIEETAQECWQKMTGERNFSQQLIQVCSQALENATTHILNKTLQTNNF